MARLSKAQRKAQAERQQKADAGAGKSKSSPHKKDLRPLSVYQTNPRYLKFQGRPILLVGASEHYGAIINADFDYIAYFDELEQQGLNYVRVFSGVHRQVPIEGISNTLAPREEAFLCPWKRLEGTESITPKLEGEQGTFPSKPIWDMKEWDERYWSRLSDFCEEARKRNILVEYVLFAEERRKRDIDGVSGPFWEWNQYNSPAHAEMRWAGWREYFCMEVSGPEHSHWKNEYLSIMERFIERLCQELLGSDNVIFCILDRMGDFWDYYAEEIIKKWHDWCSALIQEKAPSRLIAMNYQPGSGFVEEAGSTVDIVSFHRALPEAVFANYHLKKVVASSQSNPINTTSGAHLREAIRFLMAGGGMFCHLDHSFSVENTAGPDGGELRKQLGLLRNFLENNEIWKFKPVNGYLIKGSAMVLYAHGFYDNDLDFLERLTESLLIYVYDSESIQLHCSGSYVVIRYFDIDNFNEITRIEQKVKTEMLTLVMPEGVEEALVRIDMGWKWEI